MSHSEFEIVSSIPNPVLRRLVRVKGVEFDEAFVAELISNYFNRKELHLEPKLSDAVAIYLHESDAGDGRKFQGDVLHVYRRFTSLFGNLCLCELRYMHASTFRDHLLSLGLKPVTVRKQTAILNAMLNVAFRYLDIDRLSPFRALKISGVDEKRPMRLITHDLMIEVKKKLMTHFKPYKFVGLIQLNTGMRLSEPVYARVEDCVLDHPIPHIWVRRNELSNSCVAVLGNTPGCFSTGNASPVKVDWFTKKSLASRTKPSAGRRSPAERSTTSPGTTSWIEISTAPPLRKTVVLTETD